MVDWEQLGRRWTRVTRDWPRKLTFIGLGATLILWTSGMRIMEALEPEYDWSPYNYVPPSNIYKFWSWAYDIMEARYPLAIAIAITVFGAYHMFASRKSK